MKIIYYPSALPALEGQLVPTDEPNYFAIQTIDSRYVSMSPEGLLGYATSIGAYEKCQPLSGPIVAYSRSIAPGIPPRTFYVFCQSLEKPVPAPVPNPEPVPVPQAWTFCPTVPGPEVVRCVAAALNPPSTPEGTFEVTKRVAWLLRAGGAGFLVKHPGQSNVVAWQGGLFGAAIICYPSGQIYKIQTDVPNGTWQWADDGINNGGWVAAMDLALP